MDKVRLDNRIRRERNSRNAISPIIATLLLILIAIAAGVVVYAYVLNFVGNNQPTGGPQSVISVDTACVSLSNKCSSTNALYAYVRNTGTTTITKANNISIYLTDVTTGATASSTCSISTNITPNTVQDCVGPTTALTWSGSTPSVGDSITVKAVVSDGGSATFTTHAIA
jgi:archaeal type IV pilus assembly protein PilA